MTGASSGIGRELAGLFAADGHELVLLARGMDRLESTAAELEARHGIMAHVLSEDLADPGAPDRIVESVRNLELVIDHLVNNAGFSVYGPFLETDREAERNMLQVNSVAPTALARLFAPGMAARGTGRILNVASTAAFQPGPGMAVYYATKAYLLSLSVALSVELEGTGVSVTVLCPGATRTRFVERAGLERSRLFNNERFLLDPGAVARAGYAGMLRGDRVVVPGVIHKAHDLAARFVPRGLAARMVSEIQAPLD
ncbi:MAG: SDR family NAD(P)-dependent oxidoreductase [Gemmatimonadota bacterium]